MSSRGAVPRLAYVGRLMHLAITLFRFYPLRWLGRIPRLVPWIDDYIEPAPSPAKRFRMLLEKLGGSFIKFGQVLSLQPDLVPPAYCDELFDLLDRVPPFDYEEVNRIFLEDLGKSPHEVFDRFDRKPFASASIGQVHRAVISGQSLAVKVQRPTVLRDFGGDIRLMKGAIWLITKLRLRRLETYRMPIKEFIAWTSDELDYRTEARYMAQVGRNTAGRAGARVPALFTDFSSSRILTTEFLEGTTLLEYLRSLDRSDPAVAYRLSKIGFSPEKFAENIIRNFIGDVFRHGLFHADLHPANLLILPDNVVGYVDFGITGVISAYGRQHVLALILALARRDVREWHEEILKISEITDESDTERFRRDVFDSASEWFEYKQGVHHLKKSYTLILLDMIRLSRDSRVLPHEEALRYMRSVITADGLISRFAPDYDISAALERLTKHHLETQALKTALSTDRMIEAWIAGANLVRGGSLRLSQLLERFEEGPHGHSGQSRSTPLPRRRALAGQACRFGLIALTLSLLIFLDDQPVHVGFNLFSAELALVGAATTRLGRTAFRWLISTR